MGFTPLTISGVSQFSSDFQSIMDRAVKIAQLPIQQLQNRDSDAIQKKTLLIGVSGAVGNLASALDGIADVSKKKALGASSSNPSVVTVGTSTANSAATYTINSVTSIASAASERTLTSYGDSAATPVGSTGDFRLTVGDQDYDFSLTNNTLIGLRDKVNALGAGVTATILTTSGGNYLSVSANTNGEQTLALKDDPNGANTDLLTATNQGSDLVFHLNGIQVQQSSNLVNSVIPGLTFTVQQASDSAVDLSLTSDTSTLSSALQSFVNGFNAVRGQVNAQTGSGAGLLTGSSVVVQLSAKLREISAYRTTDGTLRGLADLGITFDSSGQASFDPATLNNLSEQQVDDAFTFLGDDSTGLGKFAKDLKQFSDPISGIIKLEQQGLDRIDQALQTQIDTLNDRLDVMQKGLAQKLQQADTLLASLETQQNTVKASLQGLNSVLYGKTNE
jgi:flagellar hook-associated protein 2